MISKFEELPEASVPPAFPLHAISTFQSGPSGGLGIRRHNPGSPSHQFEYPHRHDFYQLLYVTGGCGRHVIDHVSFAITPPALFLLLPRQVHYWDLTAPLEGYSLVIASDYLHLDSAAATGMDRRALFERLAHTQLQLNSDLSDSLRETLDLMFDEYTARESNYASVLRAYFHILLCKVQRLTRLEEPVESGVPVQLVRRFRRLVVSHCLHQRAVAYYADLLHVSSAYLSQAVKTISGSTAGQIIRQELILEAKRLLINTDMTIDQISHHLSFDDPAYFGRYFKRETARTPGEFRRINLEKYQVRQGLSLSPASD